MVSGVAVQSDQTLMLLGLLRDFSFPGGEDAARLVRGVRVTQKGEMRLSPKGRWMPFTAEQSLDATCSSFRWDARFPFGPVVLFAVTDAYEQGRGRLVVKLGGVLPIERLTGPDADKGELQRYLAEIALCPSALLHHSTLEWDAVGARTLRVRDRQDRTGAAIDIDLGDEGCPVACRADRPFGKQAVLTPWSGKLSEFREWEGLRVPTQAEVEWDLPEGPFVYFRAEISSFVAVR